MPSFVFGSVVGNKSWSLGKSLMNDKILQAYVIDQLALLLLCIPIVEYKGLLRAYEQREREEQAS